MKHATLTRVVLAMAVVAFVAFAVWSSTPTSTRGPQSSRRAGDAQAKPRGTKWEQAITPLSGGDGPTPWHGPLVNKTAKARKRFAHSGIDAYRVRVTWYCLCFIFDDHARVFEVTVREGAVDELKAFRYDPNGSGDLIEIGTYDSVPDKYRWVKHWVPLEAMYDRIAATSTDIDDVWLRFDHTGAPKLYKLDPIRRAFDDELTIIWTDFSGSTEAGQSLETPPGVRPP